MDESVTIAILAGGRSSRMGRDKSFVELMGKPLIAHVIERVRPLSTPIIIITNQRESYKVFGLPVFIDVLSHHSSLVGLYSAVFHSSSDYTLCIACDMPFLNPALLKHIISLRAGQDAVVPVVGGHPQGLHALYRKSCLAPMLRQLVQNRLKIRDLYPQLNTRWVDEDTLRQYDSDLASFVNINTPDALKVAEANRPPEMVQRLT